MSNIRQVVDLVLSLQAEENEIKCLVRFFVNFFMYILVGWRKETRYILFRVYYLLHFYVLDQHFSNLFAPAPPFCLAQTINAPFPIHVRRSFFEIQRTFTRALKLSCELTFAHHFISYRFYRV